MRLAARLCTRSGSTSGQGETLPCPAQAALKWCRRLCVQGFPPPLTAPVGSMTRGHPVACRFLGQPAARVAGHVPCAALGFARSLMGAQAAISVAVRFCMHCPCMRARDALTSAPNRTACLAPSRIVLLRIRVACCRCDQGPGAGTCEHSLCVCWGSPPYAQTHCHRPPLAASATLSAAFPPPQTTRTRTSHAAQHSERALCVLCFPCALCACRPIGRLLASGDPARRTLSLSLCSDDADSESPEAQQARVSLLAGLVRAFFCLGDAVPLGRDTDAAARETVATLMSLLVGRFEGDRGLVPLLQGTLDAVVQNGFRPPHGDKAIASMHPVALHFVAVMGCLVRTTHPPTSLSAPNIAASVALVWRAMPLVAVHCW
jgi:hypothetical protein